nr:hypothetical protein [Gammaproteobacteria bacterium]
LLFMVITLLVYNLNLTCMSNSVSLINTPGMGFILFVTTLFSMLSVISYLGAFPRHKPVKKFAIILAVAMLVASIGLDVVFHYFVRYATMVKEDAIAPTADTIKAMSVCITHIVFLAITVILTVTMPLYKKLIQKIDTSVQTDEITIDKIDLSNE